jgi:tRNA/tmRNA/rRNA uracil-C5-methylase (TrmA/RlmC/RlmD family)
VVFVRHALPGERVRARVLERDTGRFWRAEAVEVLRASPDRVRARCAFAGPSGCGGCDWQHVAPAAQRRLKAAVVAEQLRRIGRVDPGEVEVEPVPGDLDGLGWRTRMRFAVDADGRPGLRRHRSHEVVPVSGCAIAHPELAAVGVGDRRWPDVGAVEIAIGGGGPGDDGGGSGRPSRWDRLVVLEPSGRRGRPEVPALPIPVSVAVRDRTGLHRIRGRTWLGERVRVGGRDVRFRVTGAGFWQVHPGAAQTLLEAVLDGVRARPGETVWDLYAGAGLFTAGLADAVGPSGAVVSVESDPRACADARRNLHDIPTVLLRRGTVRSVLAAAHDGSLPPRADVVVLDPPRSGAGREVTALVAGLGPRAVGYVACDPAALARDVALFAGHGYRLETLRAFDAFPMTHHVECLAVLRPGPG